MHRTHRPAALKHRRALISSRACTIASLAAAFALPLVQILRLAGWLGLAALLATRLFGIASALASLSGADFAVSCARGALSALIALPLAASAGALLERLAMLASHSLRLAKLGAELGAQRWAGIAIEIAPAKDAALLAESLEAIAQPGIQTKSKRL